MKSEEKKKAILLREQGGSIKEIARDLGVAVSSVSLWVRSIVLSSRQRQLLTKRGFSVDAIEKRRTARIGRTQRQRQELMDTASKMIKRLSQRELWLIGIALYWGEGGKTNHGAARISNSDPAVIQIMMRFFREICKVPDEKFNGHVHTFSHLNAEVAERYWSGITGISRNKFYKTYSKPSIASKGKKDSLPYGTFQIYVNNTKLFFTIMGWIERLKTFG
ncbi:hypothetical protein A2763_02865 [Candidatus Kaiserbacteria bacterium RIFCSPHIGHO2_01_FULL_54_36]|uniref:Uncharacterized protein n=1 Tax=Candidatus Kaiserbacteria bacterium RIFCSPHIGHO2_01_FULL_54_36 TaxID=1798482 RepID=A0A1F6CP27_9BACT|nr:MAG: hypothetical protein A2763_02865 [Candidatus Kaiserbacteria bacterium RIFCSPHIGHO2_01_FULL_54_36]OGG75254.1 MAG: hypothetical protein A3A41_04005 [Candidatus Kaiserbacteria bacterium RIFCSPLOWO2_01_FULL_54_22]